MPSCPQEVDRINRPAAEPHLIVQVCGGAAACRTHRTDALANRDLIAALDLDVAQVSVTGLEAVTVVDFDRVAIS
jgi:hypothetical protein